MLRLRRLASVPGGSVLNSSRTLDRYFWRFLTLLLSGAVVLLIAMNPLVAVLSEAQDTYRAQQSLHVTRSSEPQGKSQSDSTARQTLFSPRFLGWKAAAQQGSEAVHYFAGQAHRKQPTPRFNPASAQLDQQVSPRLTSLVGATSLPGLGVRPSLPAGILPTAVAVGDFNKDGKLDWAIANGGDNTIYIYLGNGDGTAQPPAIISLSGQAPVALAVADINRDGNLDLAVADADSQTVGILLGNGDGTFKPETLLPAFAVPTSGVAILDVNNDGAPDLVVGLVGNVTAGVNSGFAVLLNNGGGSFGAPIYAPTNPPNQYPSAQEFSSGDVNKDGHVDLLVTSISIWNGTPIVGGAAQIFLGNGDGTFNAGQVLVASQYSGNAPAQFVQNAVLADVNGDGCLDAVVVDSYGTAGIFPGNCNGTFNLTASGGALVYGMGDQMYGLAVADLNGDGHPDIISSGATIPQDQQFAYGVALGNMVGVRLNDGTGHFGPLSTYTGEPGMYAMAVADLSNSGRPDVITSNQNATSATVFQNNGAGDFGPPGGGYDGELEGSINGFTNPAESGFLAADLNGDGLPDLTLIEALDATTNLLQVTVMLNQGNGKFGLPIRTPVFRSDYAVGDFAFANFRGTGQNDFLGVAFDGTLSCGQPQLIYAPNNGNGRFGVPVQIPLTLTNACFAFPILAVGDFNHDGRLDFAVVTPVSGSSATPLQITTYLGNGDGTFRAPVQMSFAVPSGTFDFPPVAFVEDANGDGDQDVLVWMADNVYGPGSGSKDLIEFLGNGDGTFQQPKDVLQNLFAMTMRDLNHDGRLDVIDINSGSPQGEDAPGTAPAIVSTYLGNPDGTFTPKSTISPFLGFLDPFWGSNVSWPPSDFNPGPYIGDFNGDGNADIALFQQRTQGSGPADVQFLVGNGDGTFTPTYNVYPLGIYRAPDLAVENLFGDGRAASLYTPNYNASYSIVHAVAAPAIQAEIVETPALTRQDTVQISLNVPSSSATSVSLSASDPSVQIPSSATIPANALSVDVPFTLANSFPADQWFDITATANGSTAVAYGYLFPAGAADPFSIAAYGGFAPPPFQGSSPAPGQDSTWNAVVSTTSMAASTFQVSCSGLPSGTSCTNFAPADLSVPPAGSAVSDFMITLPLSLAPGSYPFIVSATDGYATLTTPATLSVGDFTLSLSPSSMVAQATSSVNFTYYVNQLFGYTQPITFTCSGLPAGASCNFAASSAASQLNLNQVAPGNYAVTVTGTSNSLVHSAAMQLQVISTPVISFNPAQFNLPPTLVGGSSFANIQLMNSGSAPLTISSIAVNGTGTANTLNTSDTCGSAVPPATSCNVTVNYAPTSVGAVSGTLTISDNAAGSAQQLPVTGQGVDFSFQAAPNGSTSDAVNAGQTAVYSLEITPNQFQGFVQMQCANPPPLGNCTVQSAINVTGNSPTIFQVSVTTTAPSKSALNSRFDSGLGWQQFGTVGLSCFTLCVIGIKSKRSTSIRPLRANIVLYCSVLFLAAVLSSCGGGSGGGGGGGTGNKGTPAGTYKLTISGTADGGNHTIPLTLTVN